MSITLKKLCSDTETKYSLKLIAGKSSGIQGFKHKIFGRRRECNRKI